MTCEQYRTWLFQVVAGCTRAERAVGIRHVRKCRSCSDFTAKQALLTRTLTDAEADEMLRMADDDWNDPEFKEIVESCNFP